MRKVIFGILFAGTLLAGCATSYTRDASLDQNGNPPWPRSNNQTAGPSYY